MSRPVRIVDYDPQWAKLYEKEKKRILEAVGRRIIAIEHIGSSAVPGLGGKPIMDIIAGADNSTDADECIKLLEDLGYRNVTPEPEEPDWYYCPSKIHQEETVKLKNYNLHLVKHKSDHWKKHLLFRDYLRTHPNVAQDYYELKKRLASRFCSNREGYTKAKTSFIESILAKAKNETTLAIWR